MAIVALSPQETGLRISWLWRTAGWRVAADLAREMGEKDLGIFTKLEKGKSQSPQRLFAIAQLCAGRGNVIDNIDIVLGFLYGTKDQADILVPVKSTPPDSLMGGYLSGWANPRVVDLAKVDAA